MASRKQMEADFYAAMGARIKALREASNITQSELADLFEVSQQSVFAWESGDRRIAVNHLPQLAEVLGTTVLHLIGANKEPPKANKNEKPGIVRLAAERIQQLPRARQSFVLKMITVVARMDN